MAFAGAARIFSFLDEEPETDDGYVTLVNAQEKNGGLTRLRSTQDFGHGSILIMTVRWPIQSWKGTLYLTM